MNCRWAIVVTLALAACGESSRDSAGKGESRPDGVETGAPDTGPADTDPTDTDPTDTDPADTAAPDSHPLEDTSDSAEPDEEQALILLATADARLLGEATDDAAGGAVWGAGDPDGDGHDDLLVVASENARADGKGAVYLVSGPIAGDYDLGAAGAILSSGADWEGVAVAIGAGDLDGDGLDEIAVGAPGTNSSSADGAIAIFRGPIAGERSFESAGGMLLAEAGGDQAGSALAGGVDLDGDGGPDLVVGARYSDGSAKDAGSIYVLAGALALGTAELADAGAIWRGEASDDRAGSLIAVGDANGDGIGDVLIGAPRHADLLGAAYVVFGPLAGSHELGDADARLLGQEAQDMAGTGAALSPDLDGDGGGDLVIGTLREHGGEGVVWVVPGTTTGDHTAADVATVTLLGNHENDTFGTSVAAAGDLDGDGAQDLLVGAPLDEPGLGWVGSVFVFYGPLAGTLAGRDAPLKLGAEGEDWMGADVAGPGDVDGDGCDDVLVGDSRADGMEAGSGVAYLVLGGPS